MPALAIVGFTLGGALVGGLVGLWLGERGGGDYNFAPVIYGPTGSLIGALIAVAISSAVLT